MKNVSFSGNMGGYLEPTPAKKENILPEKKKKVMVKTESQVAVIIKCDSLIEEVEALYDKVAHKELYDALVTLQHAKKCLSLINWN